MMESYIFLFVVLFFNFFLVFFFRFYSHFFKIIDRPDGQRKLHKKDVKVFGGTIILLNLLLYILYFYCFDRNDLLKVFHSEKELAVFLIASMSIYLIGLVDDKINLPALNKLILIATTVSISIFLNNNLIQDIHLSFFLTQIYLDKYSFIFTLFSYIIFMNAFNMLDGIDLQVGCYSCFLIIFLIFSGLEETIGIAIFVALLAYLKLNYNNKIFLGDNGALLLAYVFSYFFIKLYNSGSIQFSDEILMVLLLPGLEITRLIFERIFSNKNILKGDRNHIHHIIHFNRKNYLRFLLIQTLFVAPYFLSFAFKNNLAVIIFCSAVYFLLILIFRKKRNTKIYS